MNIIKRSGEEAPFDRSKIVVAISKANATVDDADKLTEARIQRIAEQIEAFAAAHDRALSVEEIQDLVETKIQEAGAHLVAKKYITYRYEKEKARDTQFLTEKLTASNVQNQNANVDEHSFGGRMGETTSYITKQYALKNLIGKKCSQRLVKHIALLLLTKL